LWGRGYNLFIGGLLGVLIESCWGLPLIDAKLRILGRYRAMDFGFLGRVFLGVVSRVFWCAALCVFRVWKDHFCGCGFLRFLYGLTTFTSFGSFFGVGGAGALLGLLVEDTLVLCRTRPDI
jgi:hypothetical protein